MKFGTIKEIQYKQDEDYDWYAVVYYHGLPSLRLNVERGPSWLSQLFCFTFDCWPDLVWLETDVDDWLEENYLEECMEDWN